MTASLPTAVSIPKDQELNLVGGVQIDIYDPHREAVVETVTYVRYAGRYQPDDIDAYVVRNKAGKIKVRSSAELGIDPRLGRQARINLLPAKA